MALTMKDWMTSAALDELVNAFETLKPEYSAGETLRKYPYNCSPVSLTVHLKKGRHVQLIEVRLPQLSSAKFFQLKGPMLMVTVQ
jgi:hypothetical protein